MGRKDFYLGGNGLRAVRCVRVLDEGEAGEAMCLALMLEYSK